ncbi:MAG: DUF262 domain-containing protein [Verrucomicrobiales bacterium]
MSDFGQQIIFKQLLDRHGRVEVPRIQRDYAQGREAATDVREEFLGALFDALSLPKNDPKLPRNLDFIYGSVEGEDSTRFLPLDGQQRLTTLFLLHWYAAWKDDSADQFQQLLCDQDGSRFSYSVRPSSSEFFDALAVFQPEASPENVPDLGILVKDQAWYFRHWRLDPTIQSALRMLDSIHERFQGCEDMFSRLVDEAHPAITFQLLDLANFDLSDDLYIKMNARGKPLTAFETFKARYEQTLDEQYGDETRPIDDQEFPVAEFFSRRMDTAWADFFWAHRDSETNLFDEAVMKFFRAVILLSRDPETKAYIRDVGALRSNWLKCTYTSFHDRNWIDRDFSDTLLLLLETWASDGPEMTTHLPNARYFDEVSIFEKIVAEPSELPYPEVVQLVAYVAFLNQHEGDDIDSETFQEWMRIVYNLSTNTSYDRAADLQRSISGIRMMLDHLGDALTYFAGNEKPTAGFSPQQIQEERLKAKLILSNEEWRPLIDRAEGHGYFKGQIEFLLDFAGVLPRWNEDDGEWSDEEHASFQESFERNLTFAEAMFSGAGLRKDENCRWERALLCVGDYLLPSGRQNQSFLVNASAEQGSWKRLLRGTGSCVPESRAMLGQLWDRLSPSEDIHPQLDSIIEEADDLEPWRMAFIRHSEAINYCSRRVIRKNSNNEIFLLKKTQMNGAHAELFTHCLHQDLKEDGFTDSLNLEIYSYYEPTETAIEPGIRLACEIDGKKSLFELEWHAGKFLIYQDKKEDEEFPGYVERLINVAGFKIDGDRVRRRCKQASVRGALIDLDRAIADYHGNQPNGT